MEAHRRSHSWGPFSTRVESISNDKKLDTASDVAKTPKRKHAPKPPALLKKLMPVGNHASLKLKRRASVRHRHPRTPERRQNSTDSDDGSSFVASRSNLLLNSGPVVCPPIPPEYNIAEEMSSCGSLNTRSLNSDLVFSSKDSNRWSFQHERKGKTRNKDSGESGAGHCRRHTYDVPFRQEKIIPSLETVFDSTEPSPKTVAGFEVEQKIGSFLMESKSEGTIRVQSQRDRSRSSLLSGKLQFCPDEGILIIDHHPLQTPMSHVRDHKKTRMEFKKSSKQGRGFRKRALFWGLKYKRTTSVLSKASSFLQRSTTSRDKATFKRRLFPRFFGTDKKE